MSKIVGYIVGVLVGVVILLGGALWVFLAPLFQADEMLAQIHVENVVDDRCYLVSLDILPGNDESQRDTILSRQSICGDFLGLGYEFTLPQKAFLLMQKPGIVITNLVAFEKKTRNQTGNIPVGRYDIALIESMREYVATLLKKTPMVKSITYDIKALMQKPRQGAVISYKLEPFRQQVFVECTGCED
ncbi:hypothetical protein GF339_05035 [candidate division KSB3 bacterium]|uniref:Uncharacterized protein n=1 Tax=candidate division KSB3 bacterium TaxID=2044937 RepID=A0A9D5Q5I4_9BACT|nr:hypothetical protein [candidate division KSB3 bacterium]MBD3323926.1 hypothetical protein [candidate division KSB3 bacterium]